MPDVAACSNKKCIKKEKCGRFMMIPDDFCQSYLVKEEIEGCSMFIDISNVPFKVYASLDEHPSGGG